MRKARVVKLEAIVRGYLTGAFASPCSPNPLASRFHAFDMSLSWIRISVVSITIYCTTIVRSFIHPPQVVPRCISAYQPINILTTSSYLSLVPLTTSSLITHPSPSLPSGPLSNPFRNPVRTSQSRRNCLSKDACGRPGA